MSAWPLFTVLPPHSLPTPQKLILPWIGCGSHKDAWQLIWFHIGFSVTGNNNNNIYQKNKAKWQITSCDTQTDSENIYPGLRPWMFPLHAVQTQTEPEFACCLMDVIPYMETKTWALTIQGLCLKPILLKHNIWAKMKFEAILIEYIWKQSGKWSQRRGTWKGLRYDRKQCCGRSQSVP